MGLPDLFSRWFASRGWAPRPHQLALVELARQGRSALLIAPTGGGKTLAGFLPSLIELTERRLAGDDLAHKKGKGELHTLYISPLKALATSSRRTVGTPASGGSISIPANAIILGSEPREAMPMPPHAVQSMAIVRVSGRARRSARDMEHRRAFAAL